MKRQIYRWKGPAGVNVLVGQTAPGRELRCPGDLTEAEAEHLLRQKLIVPREPAAKAGKAGGKQPQAKEG